MSVLETVLWKLLRAEKPLTVPELKEELILESRYSGTGIRLGVKRAYAKGYLERVFLYRGRGGDVYAYFVTLEGKKFLNREKKTIILEEEQT